MITKVGFDYIMKWLLLCGWFALFIGGVTHYSGSWLTYTIFSVVFLTMLISGFYRQISYGYLFLVVMLWLGFWFKLTAHLLVDYPFGESIGLFDKSASAWDEVLLVATLGGIGVLLGRIIYHLVADPGSSMLANQGGVKPIVPVWYPATRTWMWACLMFACVGLAIINASLGILQIGLVPRTILLWPLNAVISLLIGYGLTFGIATLLWWDIALGRNVSMVVYFILLEAFTSTVSIFSRGAIIYHTIPPLLSLYKNKNIVSGWSRRNIIAVSMAFFVLLAISKPLVDTLRGYYYSNGKIPILNFRSDVTIVQIKFAVDRWVGAESVMVVSAYPKKGVDFFTHGIMERREIGKDTLYTEISRPVYFGVVDKSKFQFSEIPGAIAFLYYAGQLWVVALGMIVLVLAVLASERLVFRFTSNPLLSALWGGASANSVAQMGGAPRGLLFYLFELSCGIAAICFVQSKLFSRMLQKSSAFISVKSGV